MSRFRDIKGVTVFGTSWSGVQDVSCDLQAENFNYSADNNEDIRRVDVTKQKISFNINVLDPLYKRDIKNPKFGTSPELAFNEVLRASMSENCDVISDSAEEDQWITYIGVTKKIVEAELELRDISQLLTEGTLKIGDKDTLQFDVLPGASLTGLADQSAYERFIAYNAVITAINNAAKHGDLASGTISFKCHGDGTHTAEIYNTLSAGGSSGFEKHCGDSGTITFTAPAAVGGSGGDKDITILNCVLTKVEVVATHAGRLERRFTFESYSSDGSTSPLTIS